MIRALALAAATLSAAPLSAEPFPTQAPAIGEPKPFTVPAAESYTLPNGVTVTLIPYGLAPKAAISVRVYAGELEAAGKPRLPDLVAAMLKEGAGGRTASQLAEAAAGMGGGIGIDAGADETAIDIGVLGEHAPDAVQLLAEVVRRPNLPAGEFERVRQNLARDIAVEKSQPQPVADAILARTYFGASHPYGTLFPSDAQLAAYSLDDVRRFHVANFSGRRTRIYVAGRFDGPATRAAIARAFGDWTAGTPRPSLPATAAAGPKLILADRPGAPQSTIRIAFPAPTAGSQGDIPFRVMDALLAGAFNSRITTNIREDKGYTYSPGSDIPYHPGNASWIFQADITTDSTGPAFGEIFKEIRRLQTETPNDVDAGGMRTWLAGIFVLRNASSAGLVNSLADRDALGLPASWLDGFVPSVLAVPSPTLSSVAALLALNKATIVIVGDAAKIRPQLQALPELRGWTIEAAPAL